eukprot:m.87765 g.87765  ORF g.87765 m.87765 type:complete len:56 (-) comp21421_c0_seq1:400-567(-)
MSQKEGSMKVFITRCQDPGANLGQSCFHQRQHTPEQPPLVKRNNRTYSTQQSMSS